MFKQTSMMMSMCMDMAMMAMFMMRRAQNAVAAGHA